MNLAFSCLKSELDPSQYSIVDLGSEGAYVFTDPKLKYQDSPCAFFGNWKWLDSETNKEFLLNCERWAQSKNISYLIGPYDFSTFFNYRLKIDNFNRETFAGEPANQAHDFQLLKSLGYSAIQNYETYHFSSLESLTQLAIDHLPKIELRLEEKDLHFTTTSLQEILDQLKEFHHLSHEIFQDNFLYRPIPYSAFAKYFQFGLAPQICWQSTSLLKDKLDSKILGYSLNFKDPYNPDRLLIKTAGIHPDYRMMGLTFIGLTLFSIQQAKDLYTKASICLMRSGNYPTLLTSKLAIEKQNYALFGKKLI